MVLEYFEAYSSTSAPCKSAYHVRIAGPRMYTPGERARKRVRKFRGAERGIVVGRKVGGRRGLPTASNANVKTGE